MGGALLRAENAEALRAGPGCRRQAAAERPTTSAAEQPAGRWAAWVHPAIVPFASSRAIAAPVSPAGRRGGGERHPGAVFS
ncbi:hypothetical protein, partial [Streptomyces sp. HG99]|uniref:hypothetical protein n=1 Tax=Streptomyces sp. HG99 TaxID=1958787 RepID=UPI001C558834